MTGDECPYCGYDELSSHYHCGNCGEETGMFGHYEKSGSDWEFSCVRNEEWIAAHEDDFWEDEENA